MIPANLSLFSFHKLSWRDSVYYPSIILDIAYGPAIVQHGRYKEI